MRNLLLLFLFVLNNRTQIIPDKNNISSFFPGVTSGRDVPLGPLPLDCRGFLPLLLRATLGPSPRLPAPHTNANIIAGRRYGNDSRMLLLLLLYKERVLGNKQNA